MKLHGSLAHSHPASLLQWFQTERASGILAARGRPRPPRETGTSYRVRFEQGEVAAAAFWPPAEGLHGALSYSGTWSRERLLELEREAEDRDTPLAEILSEEQGSEETAALLRRRTKRVLYRLLEETEGSFFFDPAARPLPESLKTELHLSELLLEGARQEDEEGRVAEWMPPKHAVLRRSTASSAAPGDRGGDGAIRKALSEALEEPRSREELEDLVPEETHSLRMELVELVRSGEVEVVRQDDEEAALREREADLAGLFQAARAPSADDWPFLTRSEAELLDAFSEPRSLEAACQSLGQPRRELLSAAEFLAESGLIQAWSRPSSSSRWARSLVAGATLGAAAVVFFLFFPALAERFGKTSTQDVRAAEPLAAEPAAVEPSAPAVELPQPPPPAPPPVSAPRQDPEETFAAEIDAARAALAAGELDRADAALERAVAFRPGDPRAAELWREIQEARLPPPPPPAVLSPPTPAPAPEPPPAPETREAAPREAAPAAGSPLPGPPGSETGRLVVNSIPFGFVHVDGEEKGSTPLTLELAPGTYTLEVLRAGYKAKTRVVAVETGEQTIETFNLELLEEEEPR